MLGQPALRVDRGGTAAAGRRDRLPVGVVDEVARGEDAGHAGGRAAALDLHVAVLVDGDDVEAGVPVLVVEAMKMEHTLTAARDGVVAEVLAAAGDQVEAGAPLIRLEDEDGGAAPTAA